MSTAGGAGEKAPYADYNVHIHDCVSLASECVGSVMDGVVELPMCYEESRLSTTIPVNCRVN